MSVFAIDTSDGRRFTVEAPDEAAARREVERQIQADAAQQAPQRGLASRVLGGLVPRNIEHYRGALIGGGATAGALAGAPLGPLGAAGGGILGAGLGQTGFDFLAQMGRETGAVGPSGVLEDAPGRGIGSEGGVLGATRRATTEMAFESIFPGLGAPLRRLGRAGVRGLAHIDEAGKRLARRAEELGIPIGIEAVSPRAVVRGFRDVIGRMPFLGRPLTESSQQVEAALFKRKEAFLSELAPMMTTLTDTGVDLSERGLGRVKAWRRLFNRRYESLFAGAEEAGVRVPTRGIKQAAADLVDTFKSNLPTKKVQVKTAEGIIEREVPIKVPLNQKIVKFSENELMNLTDDMSPRQYQSLMKSLNQLIDEASDAGLLPIKRQGVILKKALEEDLLALSGPPEFRHAFEEINKNFRSFSELLESKTGRQLFRHGVNTDELFRFVFNSRSPEAMRDLRKLVGRNPFRRAVRQHIDKAFDVAIERAEEGRFSLSIIKREIGLGKPKSPEFAALREALNLSESGVKTNDLVDFFDVADAAFKSGKVDVSKFVARRAVLGGVRSAVKVLIPGAGVLGAAGGGGSLIGAAPHSMLLITAFALGTRKISRILTDPRLLKTATQAMDTTLTLTAREAHTRRFLRLVGEEFFREPTPPEFEGGPTSQTLGVPNLVPPPSRTVPQSLGR